MTAANIRPKWNALALPLAVCAIVNVAAFVAIAGHHPKYLRNYRTNPNPDAIEYVRQGHNFFQHGVFSRSSEPPYLPDIFRTPLYPLFAGGLDLIGGPWLLYAAQVLLHLGLCVIIYRLSDIVAGRRAALVAAVVTAIHPTLISLNFQAMSEILFLFFLTFSALSLARNLMRPKVAALHFVIPGLLLGLAILVRPAGLYLPVLIAVFVGVATSRIVDWTEGVRRALTFLCGVAMCVAPWIARNAITFGSPILTTNDTIVLIYYTGAGAYQVHHSIEWDAAAKMIQHDFELHSPHDMWLYHQRNLDPVEMNKQARKAIGPLLMKYPRDLCISSVTGLAKSVFSHDAAVWAHILNLRWQRPGLDGLLRLKSDAWSALFQNPPLLVAVFVMQLAISAILVPLTLVGGVVALRRGACCAYLVVLLLGYFTLVCSASGIDANTRFSAAILPFAFVLASVAVSRPSIGDCELNCSPES